MTAAATERDTLEHFRRDFSGVLLVPESADYEEARRVHNGLVDRRPALIARCRGTADVASAVRFGQEAGLELAIRGGGHSVAGLSTIDDGLLIDLSLLKGIYVDLDARTARAEPGVTWGELNREAALFGLATTGGVVSTTGIAGLTLGGGFGWLMSAHGLAADNLLSARVVTAEGEVLTVSEGEHPDLFWALRGGGGNFGVVTSLEYRLHPLGEILGGLVAYPLDVATDVLRFLRELSADAPDELGLIGALLFAPDGSGTPLVAIAVCHAGEASAAERDLEPLLAFGRPWLTQIARMPYPTMNTLLDAAYPAGALNYWKSSFLTGLTDGMIATLVDRFAAAPSQMTQIALESFHGCVTRVPVEATAVFHRDPGFNLLITSVWTDPAASDENVEWTRDLYRALEPTLAQRRYANYLDADDDGAARAAYGVHYERLGEVKRRYDPDNVFRRNVNISPA
ncbi:MAG TPA: FAD-binding oxidoreductase [Gaiellaceae bacterium]|nr:FAD-binding oxidoreductase [Gaiellaceae bacterium]